MGDILIVSVSLVLAVLTVALAAAAPTRHDRSADGWKAFWTWTAVRLGVISSLLVLVFVFRPLEPFSPRFFPVWLAVTMVGFAGGVLRVWPGRTAPPLSDPVQGLCAGVLIGAALVSNPAVTLSLDLVAAWVWALVPLSLFPDGFRAAQAHARQVIRKT